MSTTGFEAHPVFVRIGRAKLPGPAAKEEVSAIRAAILQGLKTPVDADVLPPAPREFLCKLFSAETLRSLLGARTELARLGLEESDLAFLILSRVVDKSSHSQTDGIYKAPTSKKMARSPSEACEETVTMVQGDIATFGDSDFAARSRVVAHSSETMRELESESVSIVVTSPPYLNNFDYAEMTRMLLYFWGIAASWGDITARVRKHLITNTTTALQGQKHLQAAHRQQIPSTVLSGLDGLVSELKHRRAERAGKKEYDYLVYPYFAQMLCVLKECRRCLRTGGCIHIMVADAALYGIHISTPQILAEMLKYIGFESVKCEQVRARGHRWKLTKREGSNQGLGEYHVSARK